MVGFAGSDYAWEVGYVCPDLESDCFGKFREGMELIHFVEGCARVIDVR
jgi:hypothetical protein